MSGIDRTFNLGCFFVTSIVYKNTRVVRRETNDHPIFLGPILLHKDAGCDKYHFFLSHISARLSSTINNVDVILPPGIHIGSDDEEAAKYLQNCALLPSIVVIMLHLSSN
jgi:hypothetical protein